MLDRRLIVENAELVKQNSVNRGVQVEVDRLVELEAKRREVLQQVQDLNRVQCGPFAKLITAGKKLDAATVGLADVLADAADQDFIPAGRVDGHGESAGLYVVDQLHARCIS